ncbi:hypothetical protein [Loigolactobacillus zhaoyuanensis]|uniref:Uncharacterized protein n=1 Tax=Loigolactobacillus zhaoyuanensis TaxID=2486017 RepID=A0ABW8U8X3_9LACO|nr:hypothetical protein [Loigolactobacillus zhaoyuanensis]
MKLIAKTTYSFLLAGVILLLLGLARQLTPLWVAGLALLVVSFSRFQRQRHSRK